MANLKTKKYPLSVNGINRLIADLDAYENRLIRKAQQLVKELKNVGLIEAKRRIDNAAGEDIDKSYKPNYKLRLEGNRAIIEITLVGEGIMFIEFGAGIHYNTPVGQSPHPRGEELGYKIGYYPKGSTELSLGKLHEWTHNGKKTHGTQATMPMLGIVSEAKRQADECCRKVFSK